MRIRSCLLLAASVVCVPTLAHAQDFGVMQSAETINVRNFKLRFNPIVVFGRDDAPNDSGVAIVGGYGFTRSFDVEGGVAFFDGVTFIGGNAEFWIVKERPFDFSIAAGFHRRMGDGTADFNGIDLTFLASGHLARRFELYGGLDLAFEGLGEDFGDFHTMHFVPGFEYRISDSIDLVAEAGIALNDNSRHYLTGGLALYFR